MREIAPNLEAHWFETYGNVALTGKPVRFINEARALNRWFDVYAFRFGGDDSRKVALLFMNITERRQTEKALLTAKDKIARHALELEQVIMERTSELRVILANWKDSPTAYRTICARRCEPCKASPNIWWKNTAANWMNRESTIFSKSCAPPSGWTG
jgi:hypothetical protein